MSLSERPQPESVQAQYSHASNLLARSGLHERFSTDKQGWTAWAFDQLDLPPNASILELGCGDGSLWVQNANRIPAGWQITLTDQSPAMLEATRRNVSSLRRDFTFQLADAGSIPFESGRFDAVLACFVLHHLPDVEAALREMHRVLRPGGRLYVTANAYDHMRELREMLRPLASDLPFVRQDHLAVFGLWNGHERLSRHFPRVDLRFYEDALEVTQVEPLLAYALSLRGAKSAMTPEKIGRLRAGLAEQLSREGVIRIAKSTGMFIAARNGPRSASTGPRPASTRDLPATVVTLGTVVRRAVPEDLRQLAAWPRYVGLLESLSLTGTPVTSADGKRWWEKMDAPDRCHYSVVLPQSGEVIGIHAFVRIDWDNAIIGNMGIRIRADLCHQGYGSESLRPLLQAVLASGIETIRLDVAATNAAAVRCYEKCGMRIVGEFWRQHSARSIDPADPSWAPLMPHFRRDGDGWLVRFYWMEISTKLAPPRGSTT